MTTSGKWRAVIDRIAAYEANGAQLGVAVSANGEVFAHGGEKQFVAASTVKVPVMVDLCRRVEAGTLHLDQKITITRDLLAPGSGVLLHLAEGLTLTVKDLIYLMISISDNTASNILIDVAGMQSVNDTMRSLGMHRSNLGRHMKGRAAQGNEIENLATANDYAQLMAALLDAKAASAASCALMLDMLRKQQNSRRIARFLPAADIDWGSKTGSVPGVANDVGFVRSGRGRMILSIFTSGFARQVDAEEAIGQIALASLIAGGILTG